jgi:shikimate kinase / 3-dehydroquinate synthase
MNRQATNIVITGFSGSGKSLVAKEVARRLNWSVIDIDAEIVKLAGKPITDIFQREGEGRFRELERQVIEKACQRKQTVIAIGGGAIVDLGNYELLAQNGFLFCLEAKPETIYQRLFQNAIYGSEPEVRPLLAEDNPLERISELKASRQRYYANSDWTVHTDRLSIDQVAEEVIRGWRLLRQADSFQLSAFSDKDIACRVTTATQSYPIFVGYGLLDRLGVKIKGSGLSGVITIISDEAVFSIYGTKVAESLKRAGFTVNSFVVPPGEQSKSMDSAVKIYDFLVERRVERDDILIALGGGMVGDLAGFVAATFLRGIPWIQVPTSLVAMVDASIGGKVGVNHPQGKNLIGAFYQPSFVLADCQTLTTLSQRELTSGWAEVVKYGLILDKVFFEFLEADADKLMKLEPDAASQAIARSAAIKAHIVSQDEKERGIRIILNYGHTIAHGLEAATQYKHFLHGEAVAVGMMGAARLSQKLGLLSPEAVGRQQSLLQKFGLPVKCHYERGEALSEITRAMELDKKIRAKAVRWVLLEDIGQATIRSDVSRQDVLSVLRELL